QQQQQQLAQQAEQQRQRQEEEKQRAEMKNVMLSQILDQAARARLNTLAMTKPEKAALVEQRLIAMARSGQIADKVSEEQLKQILESAGGSGSSKSVNVKFDRRRAAIDSDDDDY
ncbi:hypothetical protein BOX15_Mlig021263g1, partial [Macrostomum lignano]